MEARGDTDVHIVRYALEKGAKDNNPNHLTTHSLRSGPSEQLKLNSFIRESECLEESGTCCSRSILFLQNRKDPKVSLVNL